MSQAPLIPDVFEQEKSRSNGAINRMDALDRAVHDWYRFVLSFPPHLVREYLQRFRLSPGQTVLDPFCGTGTTAVEARLQGFAAVGVEANALAHFASSVKTNWAVDPALLLDHARQIAGLAEQRIEQTTPDALLTLPPAALALLLKDSISPLPLHKAL